MSYYSRAYDDNMQIKSNHFILSNVTSTFLRRHNITISVDKFKNIVRHSRPSLIVTTGGAGHSRHTKVYDINDFKKYQNQREFKL